MARLTIRTNGDLGPLSLRVVSATGRLVEPPPAPLSSAQRLSVADGLGEGTYVVIATRPSGETLTEQVVVGPAGGEAVLSVQELSPNEFLSEASQRGLVPTLSAEETRTDHAAAARDQAAAQVGASGDAGRALRALGGMAISTGVSFVLPALAGAATSALFKSLLASAAKANPAQEAVYSLRHWTFLDGRWRQDAAPARAPESVDVGPGYVRVGIPPLRGGARPAQALGLLDAQGYGPIVIAPPFRDGLDITFLADGLTAEGSAERVDNPSAVKVPVAVALPRRAMAADLLSGLAAAGLPGADKLWSGQDGLRDVDDAFDLLFHKFGDSAAAVLGAHYLLRFTPKRIPVAWLENLMALLPEIADGPTLLAWRYITAGGKQGAKVTRREIQDLLREASRRPVHYFARSRALLSQGVRLYGPWSRNRKIETAARRSPRPGDFLDVAADAGGLEAFWGSSPGLPWRRDPPARWATPPIFQVRLRNGMFAESTPAVGR